MVDQHSFQVFPRIIRRETPLINASIIYPGGDSGYQALAESLMHAMEQISGIRPDLQADTDLMPARSTPLPDSYRQRPLILLGSLNTNRALLPLYARYECATDATYPGGSGYDLRTIVNPYGTGANVILAGGSSHQGVRRAVERLIGHIIVSGGEVPFLLAVELEPALARALAQWGDAPLDAALEDGTSKPGVRKTHAFNEDVMKLIGAYGIMYAWTGDRRYGAFACERLKSLNAQMVDSYGDWHYRAERMLRVIPWLIAGGFLDDADILRTDQLLLGTALGTQHMWWRMRSGNPPLGHRHHGRGTFEFLLLARYLKQQANPNDALRHQCDRWIAECQTYLDGLGRAGIDDQDDESTLTNLATVFWYALGEERLDFFESGSARLVAERALALHDNTGAGAGQGGYGEGLPGAAYWQQEATVQTAACAFYYQDSGLKWLLENMPHLKAPLISGFLHFSPLFMHLFHTGDELPAVPPNDWAGIRALPITPHQYAISTQPPEHIEYAGHSVNAPETWRRGEGIGVNTLPLEQGFDKIVLRGGFAPDDPYLLLQGYQGGFRWQGHMQAANCIVRFSQAGHIFLLQNTNRHSHYHKNGLFITDGYNNTPLPPIAERIAAADFAQIGLAVTRLRDFHHADWTRHVFWLKKAAGLFVVFDSVAFQDEGEYALTCTWRTPAFAQLEDCSWQTRQGDHQFTLRWGERLDATSEEEMEQGGAIPFVLRQSKAGRFRAGDVATFQNLFYVRHLNSPDRLAIHKLNARQAVLARDGQPFAWCAIADTQGEVRGSGLTFRTAGVWVSADEIAATGFTHFTSPGWVIESTLPINFSLDLASGRVSAWIDGTAAEETTLRLLLGAATFTLSVDSRTAHIDLPAQASRDLAAMLRDNFAELRAASDENWHSEADVKAAEWTPAWSFNNWTLLPKRIREMTVESAPNPLDGFAEQLIDGVIAEVRQTRQQWPEAERYEITLSLADAPLIDHVRIVGDSQVDPTLRTFHPLPADISVEISGDHFQADVRRCPVAAESGVLRYKLFRDIEDQLETRRAAVRAKASQIRVRVPAPADGSPLVLHEIEVYSSDKVVPPVQYLISAALPGTGQPALFVVNTANELIALSEHGAECWRKRFSVPVTHLSVHDLHGGGQLSVCVGLLGGELRIFAAGGALETVIPLAQRFLGQRDAYFGRVYTIHDVKVWGRDANGRAALVVGGYSLICFLDPDGQIIGHSWADGSWQSDILVTPKTGDLWVRNGWNHGISVYEGKSGLAPSGETISFGGVNQPMFRGLLKVIPFVNGKTAAFEWIGGNILAAAENGVGVLSTERLDWLWTIEGGTPITSCTAVHDEVIVGGSDGFIAAFAPADGRPLRKLRLDSPVTGLAALGDSLAVATRRQVVLLDEHWQIRQAYPRPVRQIVRLAQNKLVIVCEQGPLEMLSGLSDVS